MSKLKLRVKLMIDALWGNIVKKFLGKHAYAIVAKTQEGLFAIDPEDMGVGKALLKYGSYGKNELTILQSYLTGKSKVLIIGAHIGALVIPLAKTSKECVAIEANPETFELLSTNLKLNEISNCRAINIAASNKNESLRFLMSRANSGGSKRAPLHADFRYYYDHPKEILVSAVCLDEYLSEDTFDMIVMDIEGSEYFALQGMQKILSKSMALQVEFLSHHLKNVSGTNVDRFLSLITPHFSTLTIPSRSVKVGQSEFLGVLNEIYTKEEGADIIFVKDMPSKKCN